MSLIIDMEMPKDCLSCALLQDEVDYCPLQTEAQNEKHKSWDDMRRECPLRSTADVVEVVRCKDCAHGIEDRNPFAGEPLLWCERLRRGVRFTFFCADGERKEDEE